MNKIKILIKNEYIYSIITKFITVLIGLFQSVITARFLGSSLQGLSSYISSIMAIGSIVITLGLHQAYPYFRKKYGKEYIYQDFLSIIVIIYTIYAIVAFFLAGFLFKTVELRIAIILMPVYGYDNVVSYICLIESPNKRNRWWTLISLADLIFVMVLMLLSDSSILSVVEILLFAEGLKSIVYTGMLHIKLHFHKGLIKLAIKMFRMGIFPMLALLMTTLNYKIDILMLRSFEFITAAQIGIYSIGMTYADKIALIPDTLKGVLVSKLSKGADEHEVARVARLCFWASIIMCISFMIIGEPFFNFFYGKEYTGAYQVLMICSVGSIFVGFFKLIAQYNIVHRRQIRNVILLSISIISNILLNCILIPKFQLAGAAFASGVGYFLSGIVFIIWFAKGNKISIREMFLIQRSDFFMLKGLKKNNF